MLTCFKHVSSFLLSTIFISFCFPLCCQEVSTIAEIYDCEIGDIFHIKDLLYHDGPRGGYFTYYNNIEIIDKYYSSGQDTLYYVRKVKTTRGIFNPNYLDTIPYTNLYSLISVDTNEVDTVFDDPGLYNGRKINQIIYEYITASEGNFWTYNFVNGCGLAYYHNFNANWERLQDHWLDLIYFKKGHEEWGTSYYIGTQELHTSIVVYPNPATDLINIDLNNNHNLPMECKIYDIIGRLVLATTISTNQNNIVDVSGLTSGTCIIKIYDGFKAWNKKLIIN